MNTGIKVCDAMTNKPVTLSPSTLVSECAKIMAENHVGSIIVLEDGNLVGVVTEQDLVRKVIALGLNVTKTPLKAIMVFDVNVISPEADISEAILVMKNKNVRHLPVVSDNKLVGYITGKDILKLQPHLFETLAEVIELREQERKLDLLDS